MKKNEKNSMLHIQLKKVGDKLVFVKDSDKILHENFVKSLEQDQYVDSFFDSNVDTGTNAQIAKIKASIRGLALDTGETFEDMELKVKKKSGLYFEKELDGERWKIIKSFALCSKEELSLCIQTILQIEDFVYNNPKDFT